MLGIYQHHLMLPNVPFLMGLPIFAQHVLHPIDVMPAAPFLHVLAFPRVENDSFFDICTKTQ